MKSKKTVAPKPVPKAAAKPVPRSPLFSATAAASGVINRDVARIGTKPAKAARKPTAKAVKAAKAKEAKAAKAQKGKHLEVRVLLSEHTRGTITINAQLVDGPPALPLVHVPQDKGPLIVHVPVGGD